MKVTISRHAHFNAAHRLNNPAWSAKKNRTIFGKCNNPHYHGHNYELIVSVRGDIDPETGFVMDLSILADLIEKYVEDYLDHKNLNIEVEEFKELIPTVEWISVVIWNRLRPHIPEGMDLKVLLYETPRDFCEYSGPAQN